MHVCVSACRSGKVKANAANRQSLVKVHVGCVRNKVRELARVLRLLRQIADGVSIVSTP